MDNSVKIFGKLTDFEGNLISDGDVVIKDCKFNNLYATKTDEYGNYNLEVARGIYMAIYAVKGYGVDNLEYWGWNLPAFEDTEVNMRINGIEVYGINAFMIQRTQPSIMLYFRPMSLKRGLRFREEQLYHNENDIINISPNLQMDDIEVKIDNLIVSILEINKVVEKSSDSKQSMFGYLVQVTIPDKKIEYEYTKIHITLKDSETNEKGEGSLFWQKPRSFIV
jgi:hypothetical protein